MRALRSSREVSGVAVEVVARKEGTARFMIEWTLGLCPPKRWFAKNDANPISTDEVGQNVAAGTRSPCDRLRASKLAITVSIGMEWQQANSMFRIDRQGQW